MSQSFLTLRIFSPQESSILSSFKRVCHNLGLCTRQKIMFSLARVSHNLGLCTRHTKIESFIVSKIQLSSAVSHNLGLCTRHTNRVSLSRVSLNSGLCTEHQIKIHQINTLQTESASILGFVQNTKIPCN